MGANWGNGDLQVLPAVFEVRNGEKILSRNLIMELDFILPGASLRRSILRRQNAIRMGNH